MTTAKERTIYLLLSDTGTVLNRLIKCYTGQPYNHASIAFDVEMTEVYSFGRKVAYNPFIGGFVREDLHSELFKEAACAVYALSVTPDQYQRMYRYVQRIAAQQERYRYNFIGLFGVMLNTPTKREHAFFCSQFVASVFIEGKVMDHVKDPSLIEPGELPYFADCRLLFEGKIEEYQTKIIHLSNFNTLLNSGCSII